MSREGRQQPTGGPPAVAGPTTAGLGGLQQEAREHVWLHTTPWAEIEQIDGLRVIVSGHGCWVKTADGREFLDACSGLWCVNAGYGQARIADAMRNQVMQVPYVRPSGYTSAPTTHLGTRLAAITPGDLSRTFFVNGGTEANETALKIARQYHVLNGEPGRQKVIARRYSYHGASFGLMAVTSSTQINKGYFEPLSLNARHVPGPNCYRCDYSLSYPSCNVHCARTIASLVEFEGPDTVAAIIAEPISNSAGVVVPPDEYWPALREICDRYGILLIADEVITGFGRTGKMFCLEHWGVVPDILTLAKGLSSSYAPIGAAVARESIAARFRPGKQQAFQHIVTFGGHPVSCAAALANLDILVGDGLVENASAMGQLFLDGAHHLAAVHPTIGDVRGKGLMCGVELVRERSTRGLFTGSDRQRMRQMIKDHFEAHGILAHLLGGPGDILPFLPPLVINRSEVNQFLETLDSGLAKVENAFDIRG